MGELTRPASDHLVGPEFVSFLLAPIGEDGNGMLLAVLSALARLDLDPWQEAATLAQGSEEAAIDRLTTLIAKLPNRPSAQTGPRIIAVRLIALLPSRASANIPSHKIMSRVSTVPDFRAAVAFAIFMALVLTAQSILASLRPPAQVDNARSAATSTMERPQSPPTGQ